MYRTRMIAAAGVAALLAAVVLMALSAPASRAEGHPPAPGHRAQLIQVRTAPWHPAGFERKLHTYLR
jgi:hypothetical protein